MSERFSREVLALALVRSSAAALKREPSSPEYRAELTRHLVQAVDVLDNLGVFSAVDRQTDYTAAEDILSANAADRPLASPSGLAFTQIRHPAGGDIIKSPGLQDASPDPAEWGDTTAADMASHQGLNQVPLSPAGGWSSGQLADTTGKDDDTDDGRF